MSASSSSSDAEFDSMRRSETCYVYFVRMRNIATCRLLKSNVQFPSGHGKTSKHGRHFPSPVFFLKRDCETDSIPATYAV